MTFAALLLLLLSVGRVGAYSQTDKGAIISSVTIEQMEPDRFAQLLVYDVRTRNGTGAITYGPMSDPFWVGNNGRAFNAFSAQYGYWYGVAAYNSTTLRIINSNYRASWLGKDAKLEFAACMLDIPQGFTIQCTAYDDVNNHLIIVSIDGTVWAVDSGTCSVINRFKVKYQMQPEQCVVDGQGRLWTFTITPNASATWMDLTYGNLGILSLPSNSLKLGSRTQKTDIAIDEARNDAVYLGWSNGADNGLAHCISGEDSCTSVSYSFVKQGWSGSFRILNPKYMLIQDTGVNGNGPDYFKVFDMFNNVFNSTGIQLDDSCGPLADYCFRARWLVDRQYTTPPAS